MKIPMIQLKLYEVGVLIGKVLVPKLIEGVKILYQKRKCMQRKVEYFVCVYTIMIIILTQQERMTLEYKFAYIHKILDHGNII